jgi:hypothetical protein
MKKPPPLPRLIEQLAEAMRTYDRLALDEEGEHKLGKPCSPKQIAALEKILGKPLPPSYKAFMELHNGWDDFSGDAKLLAVEDHKSEMVKERLLDMEELFADTDEENPFEKGAMPVLLGEDSNMCLFLDPNTIRPNGEMDYVLLDIVKEEERFKDFTSFLEYRLDLFKRMIDKETKGIEDE